VTIFRTSCTADAQPKSDGKWLRSVFVAGAVVPCLLTELTNVAAQETLDNRDTFRSRKNQGLQTVSRLFQSGEEVIHVLTNESLTNELSIACIFMMQALERKTCLECTSASVGLTSCRLAEF